MPNKNNPSNLQEGETVDITPTHIKPYLSRYQTTLYSRIAYFYYIMQSQILNYPYWTVKNILKKNQGDPDFLYGPYTFATNFKNKDAPVKVALVADMDATPNALPTISELSNLKVDDIDMYLHVGDMAYDLDTNSGIVGDNYFNTIVPIQTKIATMPIGGNHEHNDKGGMFNYRFRMPRTLISNPRRNAWYSYDYKNVHFVAVDFDHILR